MLTMYILSVNITTQKTSKTREMPYLYVYLLSRMYRRVQNSLYYPLVFIVSESHHGSSHLFRKEYTAKIDLHTIRYSGSVIATPLYKTIWLCPKSLRV